MKNAPCVRFASRISPKIRENPDDSRNNSPPSDRLLRPWMIQNCIVGRSSSKDFLDRRPAPAAELLLQVPRWRVVARIDRVLQECGLVISPELSDGRIGLDDGVDQPAIALGHLADIDVADPVSELVEFDDTPHGVCAA